MNRYKVGDLVYLITDPDQLVRIIVDVISSEINGVSYECHQAAECSFHKDIELCKEKNFLI